MNNPTQSGKHLIVGKLTGVYGVKGWLKVHSYTEPPDNIFNYTPWFLANADGTVLDPAVAIDDYRIHGKGLVVHVKGVDDRDQAAMYCQRLIAVDMKNLPELPAGEYYWQDLQGLMVLTIYGGRETAPQLLGQVSYLMETGANDVMVVVPCEGSIDQRERLLPYVDACVLKVDLQNGQMLVDWDPGF